MTFKSTPLPLSLLLLTVLAIGCSAKEPERMIGFGPQPELTEQDTVLVSLGTSDVVQLLFAELTRVAWFSDVSARAFPPEDVVDGCMIYQSKPEEKIVVVGADCTGVDPSPDMNRTVRGSGVVRGLESGSQYAASFEVRRFRPRQPNKTVRNGLLENSILLVTMASDTDAKEHTKTVESTTSYLGGKSRKVGKAESYTTSIVGELLSRQGALPTLTSTKTVSIRYTSESGSAETLTFKPRGDVKFATGADGACPRPVGTFDTSLGRSIVTTTEGFKIEGSTSVVAWPAGCLENVSR